MVLMVATREFEQITVGYRVPCMGLGRGFAGLIDCKVMRGDCQYKADIKAMYKLYIHCG